MGTIYLIFCKDSNIKAKYIGCTQDFDKRVQAHKHCCSNGDRVQHTYKLYQFIRDNGGWDNWNMIKLETFIYLNNQEKHAKEYEYFKQFEPILNSNQPNRNQKESYAEYYKKNRAYLKAKMMERYFRKKSEKLKNI